MLSFITSNWEWMLLALYVLEKGIKLSPSTKDDLVWDMFLKPIVDKIKSKQEEVMSLYKNMNKRKKAGTSRSKKNSTITKKIYKKMKDNFGKKKKK